MVIFDLILDHRRLELFQIHFLQQGAHHIRVSGNPPPKTKNLEMGRRRNKTLGQNRQVRLVSLKIESKP